MKASFAYHCGHDGNARCDRTDQSAGGRIVPVHEVHDLTVEGPSIERELALFKVHGTGEKRIEALRLAEIFRANVVDSTLESFVFEMTGPSKRSTLLPS